MPDTVRTNDVPFGPVSLFEASECTKVIAAVLGGMKNDGRQDSREYAHLKRINETMGRACGDRMKEYAKENGLSPQTIVLHETVTPMHPLEAEHDA